MLIACDDIYEHICITHAAPAGATVSIDEVESCLTSCQFVVQAAAAAPTESPTGITQSPHPQLESSVLDDKWAC